MQHRINVKTREELSLVGRLLETFETNYTVIGPEALEISIKDYGDKQKHNYELVIEPAKGYEIKQVCQTNKVDSRRNKLLISSPERVILQIGEHKFKVEYKPSK